MAPAKYSLQFNGGLYSSRQSFPSLHYPPICEFSILINCALVSRIILSERSQLILRYFSLIQISSFPSFFISRLAMDYEFDNALFWGDENDGKIPVRTTKKKSTASTKTTPDVAYPASDRSVQASRLTTPVSRFTLDTAQTQALSSFYTSSEVSGPGNYPARAVARPSISQPEPVVAPAHNRDPPRNIPPNNKYGKPGPYFSDGLSPKHRQPVSYPSDGQSYKYGQPVLYPSEGRNPYRNEPQRLQGQDRGRRPYTNSTPSVSGSRPQSRVQSRLGRNSFHQGSDLEGEGGFRSAFITPNLYFSESHSLGPGPDGYEGPDGFLRDNDADRAERAGMAPDGEFILDPLRQI